MASDPKQPVDAAVGHPNKTEGKPIAESLVPSATTHHDHPEEGKKYLIKHCETGKFLVVCFGGLLMEPVVKHGMAAEWLCDEEGGWLTFRNTVSGGFLSLRENRYDDFVLVVHHGNSKEGKFITRELPSGGLELLVLDKHRALQRVTVEDDSDSIITAELGVVGDAWTFVAAP